MNLSIRDDIWDREDGSVVAYGKVPVLKFLMVVQGREGAAKQKLLVLYSLPELMYALCHETLNGFSVVFVGATLTAVPVPGKVGEELVVVTSIEAAEGVFEDGNLPIIC
jgi:hypothetical protein